MLDPRSDTENGTINLYFLPIDWLGPSNIWIVCQATNLSASNLWSSDQVCLNWSNSSKRCLRANCFKQSFLHLPPQCFRTNCLHHSLLRSRSFRVGPSRRFRFLAGPLTSLSSSFSLLLPSSSVNSVTGSKPTALEEEAAIHQKVVWPWLQKHITKHVKWVWNELWLRLEGSKVES